MYKILIRQCFLKKALCFLLIGMLIISNASLSNAQALSLSPTAIVAPTTVLRGLKVYPQDPFRFDFVVEHQQETDKDEANRLIKYFLASLTIPEQDLWVNLSPYEKDRIVPESFGQTEMGRDLLAQDYVLKQMTSSLMNPQEKVGKAFWEKIYQKAQEKFGTTDIPIDTFNKVWIVPAKAVVYENAQTKAIYIVESKLNVMLETDYLAESKNVMSTGGHTPEGGVSPSRLPSNLGLNVKATQGSTDSQTSDSQSIAQEILKEIIIPVLEKEVNEGASFKMLRQIYHSLILATWYKNKIKESLLSKGYVDQNKTHGIRLEDNLTAEEKIVKAENIWQDYVELFKKGVYNFIQEENINGEIIPKQYFSGGKDFTATSKLLEITQDPSQLEQGLLPLDVVQTHAVILNQQNRQSLTRIPDDILINYRGQNLYVQEIVGLSERKEIIDQWMEKRKQGVVNDEIADFYWRLPIDSFENHRMVAVRLENKDVVAIQIFEKITHPVTAEGIISFKQTDAVSNKDVYLLKAVAVEDAYQRRGLYKLILAKTMQISLEEKGDVASFLMQPKDEEAENIFLHVGFKRVPIDEELLSPDELGEEGEDDPHVYRWEYLTKKEAKRILDETLQEVVEVERTVQKRGFIFTKEEERLIADWESQYRQLPVFGQLRGQTHIEQAQNVILFLRNASETIGLLDDQKWDFEKRMDFNVIDQKTKDVRRFRAHWPEKISFMTWFFHDSITNLFSLSMGMDFFFDVFLQENEEINSVDLRNVIWFCYRMKKSIKDVKTFISILNALIKTLDGRDIKSDWPKETEERGVVEWSQAFNWFSYQMFVRHRNALINRLVMKKVLPEMMIAVENFEKLYQEIAPSFLKRIRSIEGWESIWNQVVIEEDQKEKENLNQKRDKQYQRILNGEVIGLKVDVLDEQGQVLKKQVNFQDVPVGGIDLTASYLQIDTLNQEEKVSFYIDQQHITALQQSAGLRMDIVGTSSVVTIKDFLLNK